MTLRRILILVFAFLVVSPMHAQGRQRSVGRTPPPALTWQTPQCASVSGLPSMRFVTGEIAAKNVDSVANVSVSSIAPGNRPNVLYATYRGSLYESRNAGCTWSLRAELGPELRDGWHIVLARTERIVVHDRDTLLQITAAGTSTSALPESMLEVFVDPADARHMRGIALYGTAYESEDGGATWSALADVTQQSLYSAAVDPSNFDHLVAAMWRDGVAVTYDGGRTWTRTGALTNTNVFFMNVSPADPRVVWAAGVSTLEQKDRVYRSIDGGMTFAPVLASSAELPFSRAAIAPHPADANVVAFIATNGVATYDHATGNVTIADGVLPTAIAWSPAGTLYFAAPDEVVIIN